MSEIMKCPECGNDPLFMPTHDQTDPYPEAVECCSAAFTTVAAWNKYVALEARYNKLQARYNALREAVARERECVDAWEYGAALTMQALDEQFASMSAARVEVDRILEES